MRRRCGDCQLCCKLLPVHELAKGAGQRCQHQRAGKGCAVYHRVDKGFPPACGLWSCRWLVEDGTADLRRPDRSRYVIDLLPDYITITYDGEEPRNVPVIQIWIDPAHPNAHHDPALRAYLAKQGEDEGFAAIIRYNESDAMVLFPPALSEDRQWHEEHSGMPDKQHSAAEVASALSETTGADWLAVRLAEGGENERADEDAGTARQMGEGKGTGSLAARRIQEGGAVDGG